MTKAEPSNPRKMIRDPKTGQMLEVRGYGALKDKLALREGLDLTKPIYEQVAKLDQADARRVARR